MGFSASPRSTKFFTSHERRAELSLTNCLPASARNSLPNQSRLVAAAAPSTPNQPTNEPSPPEKSASRYDIDGHLLNWAEWMRHGGLPRGAPDRAAGGLLKGHKTHSEEEQEQEREHFDRQNARATDAAIHDLPTPERQAIYVEYGLQREYQFIAGHPFELTLESAKQGVKRGLIRRSIYVAA